MTLQEIKYVFHAIFEKGIYAGCKKEKKGKNNIYVIQRKHKISSCIHLLVNLYIYIYNFIIKIVKREDS